MSPEETLEPTYEFAVKFKSCCASKKVIDRLKNSPDTRSVELNDDTLVITSAASSSAILSALESSGECEAVLRGVGSDKKQGFAAVAELHCKNTKGVVRLLDISNSLLVDAVVDGLPFDSKVKFSIHKYGDLSSSDYSSCGDELAFLGETIPEHLDSDTRAVLHGTVKGLNVSDFIGRALVVSQQNKRLCAAVVARSAGLFQNSKQFCTCDGVSIWDERRVPSVGPQRAAFAQPHL